MASDVLERVDALADEVRQLRRSIDTRWRLTEDEDPPESGYYLCWKPRDGPVRTWHFEKGYYRSVWRDCGEEVLPPTHWALTLAPPG